ncbi:hypothetical protein ZWY2020_037036 [Hordeum vulgare]|nr:hypothetical protein ZWY2020_037036 [Hordeum vulgare]
MQLYLKLASLYKPSGHVANQTPYDLRSLHTHNSLCTQWRPNRSSLRRPPDRCRHHGNHTGIRGRSEPHRHRRRLQRDRDVRADPSAATFVPDFIEHRTDAIPLPCCVQVNTTVAQQPCCLMHVLRGDVARLMGPQFDSTCAMVNVTSSASATARSSCKLLPPLTPEYPFTAALPPPPPSSSGAGAGRLEGLSYAVLLVALVASFL